LPVAWGFEAVVINHPFFGAKSYRVLPWARSRAMPEARASVAILQKSC
jgi:hypothetical protein